MMSDIVNAHPAALSLSELLTLQGARALLPGRISGAAYWRQLGRPGPLIRALANPDVAPDEFLYHRVDGGRFDPFRCPPILAVTLPHLFADPDRVFDALAPAIRAAPVQDRAAHTRHLITLLAAARGGAPRVWVERSGGALLATRSLGRLFPEAGMVLLLRDGRDTVLSMQRYKPARFVIWFWARARALGIDVLDPDAHLGRARWIAWAEVLGGRSLPLARIMATPPPLQEVAGFWSAMTLAGIASWHALPAARRLALSYEEITADPAPHLARLAAFLGLPEDRHWASRAALIPQPRPARHLSLPPQERDALTRWTAAAQDSARAALQEGATPPADQRR